MFDLHPRLKQDTITVGDFPLCRLLLMNDANYPWFILVPRRNDVREIFELTATEQHQFLRESSHLSEVLYKVFHADKLNIAALGNIVAQLHIHHIVRYQTDPAWPNPVWGRVPSQPYSERERHKACTAISALLFDFQPDERWDTPSGVC